MKNEDVLTDANLLLVFAKISGFISFRTRRAKNGEKCIIFEKFHHWFFLIFQTTIQIRVLFLFYDFCKSTYKLSNSNFLYILKVISELSYNTFCVVISINSKLHATENQQFWQALYDVERNLRQLRITLNHTLLRRITKACVYSSAGTSITLSVCFLILDKQKSEDDVFYYVTLRFCNYYKVITCSFLYSQQIVSFSILKEIFEKLEKGVKENVQDNRYSSRKYLYDITKCHQNVCEIARQFNNVIAVPLVFEFAHLFCFLTANSFGCMIAVIKNVHVSVDIMRLIWITIVLFIVTLMVVVSCSCMKKVGE